MGKLVGKAKLDEEKFKPNSVEHEKREDGKWLWRIKAGNGKIIATDGGQGYENEVDCLHGLFAVFFGAYDLSYMTAYSRWQELSGEAPPEAFVREVDEEHAVLRAMRETKPPHVKSALGLSESGDDTQGGDR